MASGNGLLKVPLYKVDAEGTSKWTQPCSRWKLSWKWDCRGGVYRELLTRDPGVECSRELLTRDPMDKSAAMSALVGIAERSSRTK